MKTEYEAYIAIRDVVHAELSAVLMESGGYPHQQALGAARSSAARKGASLPAALRRWADRGRALGARLFGRGAS